MGLPEFTTAGADLYERMSPWAAQDPENGYALAWICHGIGLIMQQVYEAGQLGFEQLDDPDTTPAWFLPFLAMRNGVRLVPEGLSEDQQRARVRSTDGLRRGTPEAIVGAARQHLTGLERVILRERTDPDNPGDAPYHYAVYTYSSETPDSALVEAALLEQKPVGHILHYAVVSDNSWDAESGTWDELAGTVTWNNDI
jgi:hypothetical protein